jgi:hypothetical protein
MIRFFVFAEPYGPQDFTICQTAADAVRTVADLRDQGLNTRLIETTGTAADLKPTRMALRADYLKSLTHSTQVPS